VAQQEVNLEQTDFSAGYITDINPLMFPPNATVDEANFEIRPDGSRHRRKGLELERDESGLITPPATFYNKARVSSRVYSTLSPIASVDTPYNQRKKDVLTVTDVDSIRSYDMSTDDITLLTYSATNGTSPYLTTKHTTKQAYVSTNPSTNRYMLSLIYGWNGSSLGVTNPADVTYGSHSSPTNVLNTDTKIADISSWSGRVIYAFNTNDDSSGQAIGISALPDPTTSAASQVTSLARCRAATADLKADDGAWIYAGDLGAIKRIIPYRTGLLIFTDENIWYLNAPSGYFNPYDFTFDKISDTRVSGKDSFILIDNKLFFWAESGMYLIYPDENTGLPKLQNISENKIQKWYESLLPEGRRQSIGVYNKTQNECRWLYQRAAQDFANLDKQKYFDELILSLDTGSFTLNKYERNDDTFIMDFVPDNAVEESFENASVTVGGVEVVAGGVPVYAEFLATFRYTSEYKYVIRDGGTQARLAALKDNNFVDFLGSVGFPNGVDAKAYIKSGWFTFQDTQRKKTPNWLTVTCQATESGYDVDQDVLLTPSSCMASAYWDYANDDYSAKVHGPYETYRLNRLYFPNTNEWEYGQDFITTKNKIRGRGRTLQFKYETSPSKDCRLYSWGYNGNVLTRV
jgi:hypothetical protein